jgi:cell division transport system permease protein
MFTGIRRVVRAGFVGFWRNAYVSLASIFVMAVALFVIGATMFIEQLLTSSLSALQSKVDINVYFVPEAPQEEIDAIREAVEALPEVAMVTYLSREEALARYRQLYQNNEIAMQALEELGENPLGATIAIQARETSQYENIARFIEEQRERTAAETPVIDHVNYARNKESIDRLTSIIAAVERASFMVMLVLLAAAILISFNTIRLAIYTAREEIGIMRLVGASNTFIRGPFMLQGVMYGVVSGVLALLVFYPVMVWLGPSTEQYFEINLLTYYVDNFTYFFTTLVGIGVAIGLVSSTLAVARYLRV